jgi:hypothetical protein
VGKQARCLPAALDYASKGWLVFPAPRDTKKSHKSAEHSNGRRWGATADADEIRADFERWPLANIGIPTGAENAVWVLEADTKEGHNVDGIASLQALIEEHGDLPPTFRVESPSGSLHFYFNWPCDGRVITNSASRLGPGIDVRGEGGMVLAPPSVRIPIGVYSIVSNAEIADAPSWLVDLAVSAGNGGGIPDGERESNPDLEAPLAMVEAAVAVLVNDDLDWETWNNHGMAIYAATGGSGEGFVLFDKFFKKSPKYDKARTFDKWRSFHSSPPTKIGFGSLNFWANEADPLWYHDFEARLAADLHAAAMDPEMQGRGGDAEDNVADLGEARSSRSSTGNGAKSQKTEEEAAAPETEAERRPLIVALEDFYAYMPMHNYIYIHSRDHWPAASVNARIRPIRINEAKSITATAWIDRHRPVEQMTWAPGLPMLVRDRLISDGGWIAKKDASCFNLYRGPVIQRGDAAKAGPWLDHIRKVYPADADHIVNWLAHRVQHPDAKINHSIVLGGRPGIGKDTLLEPAKQAVGPWNFHEVSPKQVLGTFNGFLKSTVMRISEARDLGDISRYEFYDAMKAYTAAPPDVLRVNEKNLREYYILNCVGVIITTNYKDALYLPADDRRTYVAWSEAVKEDFSEAYWKKLWAWYHSEGFSHVAAHLATLDIAGFNAKAPPPKTPAFWTIVEINRSPEDTELADRIEAMGNPAVLTVRWLIDHDCDSPLSSVLSDRRNSRAIPHRLERCDYVSVRNPNAKDGFWKINGARQVVYAKRDLTPADQLAAILVFVRTPPF